MLCTNDVHLNKLASKTSSVCWVKKQWKRVILFIWGCVCLVWRFSMIKWSVFCFHVGKRGQQCWEAGWNTATSLLFVAWQALPRSVTTASQKPRTHILGKIWTFSVFIHSSEINILLSAKYLKRWQQWLEKQSYLACCRSSMPNDVLACDWSASLHNINLSDVVE